MVCILAVTLALPMVVGMAYAQWDRAVLEPLTSGPDHDALGRRALEIDDSGTLHAIYSRGLGSSHDIYYVSKPPGGIWSAPEPLGSPDSAPGIWCLAVRKETGEPYVTFFRGFDLTLGIRRATGWEFHTLATPPDFPPGKMAVTVDSDGYAHVAMVVRRENPLVWQIAYGYWDGSPDFHFQVLQYSLLVHYGLFHAAYLAFLLSDARVGRADHLPLAASILAFFLNHAFSFRYNLEGDRQKVRNIGTLMFFPYARIIPMHLTIIFGFGLAKGTVPLLIFLVLKTFADLIMHAVEHAALK